MNMYRSSIGLILIALLAIGGSNAFAWTSLQSAEMINFSDGTPVKGGGTLLRSGSAVEARLSIMGLDAGAAYTVWWVIFNRPYGCSAPGCGEDDIFSGPGVLNLFGIKEGQISVIYANGFVTGPDGVANVTAHLTAGKVPAGWGVNFGWMRNKNGLKSGRGNKAEIHMVVRTHGTAEEGEVGARTSNFEGGGSCGTRCSDQQAIIFNPL